MELSTQRPIFQKVYQEQRWDNGSGPGSSPANTIEYRAFIERFIEANRIRRVTDLGCGDWQFSRLIDWSRVDYLGLDIVPEIIAENRNRFAMPNVCFEEIRSTDDLPGGDLLLSKEVFQHLPNQTVAKYLAAIRQKYRFALLTNGVGLGPRTNVDITPGEYRPVHLQDAPFNAPGAIVFSYFVRTEARISFKLAVFLMFGTATS